MHRHTPHTSSHITDMVHLTSHMHICLLALHTPHVPPMYMCTPCHTHITSIKRSQYFIFPNISLSIWLSLPTLLVPVITVFAWPEILLSSWWRLRWKFDSASCLLGLACVKYVLLGSGQVTLGSLPQGCRCEAGTIHSRCYTAVAPWLYTSLAWSLSHLRALTLLCLVSLRARSLLRTDVQASSWLSSEKLASRLISGGG